ncbi:MAG: CBS domain-containing protein [Phormidesmis sp.]
MLTVSDIMTKPVVVIRSSATIANAMWVMRSQRVRSLVVEKLDPEVSYGMLTEKDIVYNVIAQGDNPGFVRVGEVMRYPCAYCSPETTIREAARMLAEADTDRAPVIEKNQLVGIVSVTDILDKGSLPAPPYDELSRRIQDALQNTRIIDDEEARIEQESDVAWRVLEDMKT